MNASKTIGVLGCGINVIYPKENTFLFERMKKSGLIISEYPMHVKPLAYHFPWRNRLIAALSSNLVVIEATYKSGTMITVNECLELSVPILVNYLSILNIGDIRLILILQISNRIPSHP